jgi:hypothetical protein
MHWWTWVIMGVVVLAGLVTLAVVARGTMRRLRPMREAQAALQSKLQHEGAALAVRSDELIVGPMELLELRARRTGEHLALLKGKRGGKADGQA